MSCTAAVGAADAEIESSPLRTRSCRRVLVSLSLEVGQVVAFGMSVLRLPPRIVWPASSAARVSPGPFSSYSDSPPAALRGVCQKR